MVWPAHLINARLEPILPSGYSLRTFIRGDNSEFYKLMDLAGWPGWNGDKLLPWRERLLPESWFMVIHYEYQSIVATAMGFHDRLEFGQQGGEIGWVACHSEHRRIGLGTAVSAAATRRLIQAGFEFIHLYTEDFRLTAIKIYLNNGYIPYLYTSEMEGRWREICNRINWPFSPRTWKS